MTREEAIAYGNRVIKLGLNDETQAFCEMAIKALEQESCADCISREAVEDAMYDATRAMDLNYGQIMEYIDKISSVIPQEPKTDWIPVSERLPEDGTWNIFTNGKNISIERYKNDALDHFFPSGRWFSLEDAVAWMPLPEPYQEG